MSTKKQLAEQVLRKISGGNVVTDGQIDIREIMLDLDQLRDDYVKQHFYQNIKEENYSVDEQFLSLYENVSITSSGGSYKLTLPANPIDLPRGLGIYMIYPHGDESDPFIIMDAGAQFIYGGKQELNVTGKNYIWFRSGVGVVKGTPSSVSVDILMVASSKDIPELDTYPLTPDAESVILDALFNKYVQTKQIPHDEIVDGQK